MNQAPLPPMPARTASSSDAPDMLFVLRHYRWLIIVGTILGTIIGYSTYYILRRYAPKYTAYVSFQVKPVPPDIGRPNPQMENIANQEEITRFIRRQMLVITGDDVLDQVLISEAFVTDARDRTSGRKSQWLMDHTVLPKYWLRKDLEVQPVPNSDVFKVAFTTKDPNEAASLVNAVGEIYVQSLSSIQKRQESVHLQELKNAQQKLQDTVVNLETQLQDFRRGNDISVVMQSQALQTATLASLNSDVIKYEIDAGAAAANLESIKKQVAGNTLVLTPDMEQFIEGDPTLRTLENQKLGLQQDLEVAKTQYAPGSKTIQSLMTRIEFITHQIDEKHEELRAQARLRMQDNAESLNAQLQTRLRDLTTRRKEQELKVKDLDNLLVQYNQRAEELKSQQEVLARVKNDATVESLKSLTDSSRVLKMNTAVAPDPSEVTSPIWYMDLMAGFALGLLASFGLGYLLELTNTRVRTPRDITRSMQLPLLGFVPDQEDDANLVGDISTSIRSSPTSMIAESFRQIRGRLAAQADGKAINTLLVASISPAGGATTIASNLANGMALNDLRVLLVDANFYRPSLKGLYKNIPAVGLTDALGNPELLDGAIVPCLDLPRLHLLGAGSKPSTGAAEMLEGKAFRDVLNQLKSRYDLIIFDGAPLSLVADSISLAAKVDGVVAVVRAGIVSRGTVTRVSNQLKQVRANLLGVILNAAQTHGAGYFKQSYRTFYEYAGQGTSVSPR